MDAPGLRQRRREKDWQDDSCKEQAAHAKNSNTGNRQIDLSHCFLPPIQTHYLLVISG
jgi:hypothetical protein